jgi:dimethylhistidine N-methyltransferase
MSAAIQSRLGTDADPLAEIVAGLQARTVSPKFFYDVRGSELFDAICSLPEYYLTRTETSILRNCAGAIADLIGTNAALVELGAGAAEKVRLLLDALQPRAYVAIDISHDFLLNATARLAHDYPWLEVQAVRADFTRPLVLQYPPPDVRRLVFFPGSSLGNFSPDAARDFLRRLRPLVGPSGGFVIGIDLQKDPRVLHAAYNDAQGLTAQFNRNVLYHLQREYGAELDPQAFEHQALYNETVGRIEMYLVATRANDIRIAGRSFHFNKGERLHTENSYKYTIASFQALARAAGYVPEAVWTDERDYFSVHYLRVA